MYMQLTCCDHFVSHQLQLDAKIDSDGWKAQMGLGLAMTPTIYSFISLILVQVYMYQVG